MIPSDHSPRLILSNCPAAAITVGSYPKINFAQVGRIRSSPRMDRLGAGRPLFHRKFGHWEIPDVGGGQAGANSDGSGRNEAVGLVQGHSAICELATPRPGADSLGHTERREAQRVHQTSSHEFLAGPQTPPDLFHGDRAEPRLGAHQTQPD